MVYPRPKQAFYRVITCVCYASVSLGFDVQFVLSLGYQIASAIATIMFYVEKFMKVFSTTFFNGCGLGVGLAALVVDARVS